MTSTTSPRTQRINLRATTDELSVLRQASIAVGTTLTSFILSTAVREAHSLLATTDTTETELS